MHVQQVRNVRAENFLLRNYHISLKILQLEQQGYTVFNQ